MTDLRRAAALSLALLAVPAAASAQGALGQMGPVSAGQTPMYVDGQHVLAVGGALLGQPPSPSVNPGTLPSLYAVVNPKVGFAQFSGYASGAYSALTFGFDGSGNVVFDIERVGGGAAPTCTFRFLGTQYSCFGSGGGIAGPNSSTAGHAVVFNNTAGNVLADAGFAPGNVAGPGSSATGNLPSFSDASGKLLADSGVAAAAVPAARIIAYPALPFTFGQTYQFQSPYPIVTAGSTTSGLAEALAVMNTHGLSLDAYGNGGAISTAAFSIGGTVGIGLTLPPLRNQYIALRGTGIYGVGGGTSMMKIGSMVEGSIDTPGSQIGMSSALSGSYTGATVLIDPTEVLPVEGFIGIASSHIRLGNLSRESDGTATLLVSVGTGNVIGSVIEALEVNGAGSTTTPHATNCVQIDSPTASTGFQYDFVHISDVHLCKTAGVQIGTSAVNASVLRNDTYFFDRIHPALSGTAGIGFDTFGSYDTITANVDNDAGGTANLAECAVLQASATHNALKINCADVNGNGNAIGVLLNPGADFNEIDLHTFGTVTVPIQDNSGGHNSYRVNGRVLQEFRNGAQYNYQTPTSVSAGAGATFVSGSTNSVGSVNVGGAGAQTTVQVNFSVTFLAAVTCQFSVNQPGTTMYTSASSTTSVTGTASAVMPANAIVSYACHGGA